MECSTTALYVHADDSNTGIQWYSENNTRYLCLPPNRLAERQLAYQSLSNDPPKKAFVIPSPNTKLFLIEVRNSKNSFDKKNLSTHMLALNCPGELEKKATE
jgi:hypothetical protein